MWRLGGGMTVTKVLAMQAWGPEFTTHFKKRQRVGQAQYGDSACSPQIGEEIWDDPWGLLAHQSSHGRIPESAKDCFRKEEQLGLAAQG